MTTDSLPIRSLARPSSRAADVAAFVAGALSAAVAIAVGELVAGLVAGAPSLVVAIGDLVIDLQPPGAKDWMVQLFGDQDKLALDVIIIAATVVVAGLVGVAARRAFWKGVVGFGAAAVVGLFAASRQPLTDMGLAVVTLVAAVAAALVTLRVLLGFTAPAWREDPASGDGDALVARALDPSGASMPDWDRRRFLLASGAVAAGSVVVGALGRNLLQTRPGGAEVGVQLPPAEGPTVAIPAAASMDVPGITPIVVPNTRFYRIDTALIVPRVDAATWTLTIKGMVDREVSLSYADLEAMPLFEQFVTIACVSNEVGGKLVGNALWRGVDLRDLLDMAGVQPDATQIVGRSVDDFTAGFPTAWAMDPDRRPMLALGMNGEPLPIDHGYPARLIIPGLYGYVSATKWIKEIELTTLEAFDGYWVPLGWAKEAPILTQSRIDVPRPASQVTAGPQPIAGVAWAPDRGVSAVEVRVDEGDWMPAELSQPLSDAAWVQWKVTWQATPGDHRLTVRATDGDGVVQTDEVTRPAPDGARGHHAIGVHVA